MLRLALTLGLVAALPACIPDSMHGRSSADGLDEARLLNAAQAVEADQGFEAAVPEFQAAAHAENGSPAGVAASFLWDHYGRQGDAASAAPCKRIARAELGEEMAWRMWAFRGHDLGSERANILAAAERLRSGSREGSEGAASELTRLVARLSAEAAGGNAAAQDVLDHLPEAHS